MPTKAELEAQLNDLSHQVRRMDRALNQASIDLASMSPSDI